jgi:tripartite ATP-independent transporter DctP family solute receptor
MTKVSRRAFLHTTAVAVAWPTMSMLPSAARAAQYRYKCGHDLPDTHPVHIRMQEAVGRIRQESGGRLDIKIFSNSQLGGDTDMLGQVRSGGVEMALMPDVILGTLAPAASISGVGFAFGTDAEACQAMDGELGSYVRTQINKAGLLAMDRIWENGFRQITSSVKPISAPADLRGFKIRVPVAPLWMSMFKYLNAGPTALNFSELYSALQTKIVEGEENPLSTIYAGKLYEVQKHCSITNHFWNGYWMLMNPGMWNALPRELQSIAERHLNQSAVDLRGDVAKVNVSLESTLATKGMTFNHTDPKPFRDELRKAGFYAEWSKKFGAEAWSLLTKSAKGLA